MSLDNQSQKETQSEATASDAEVAVNAEEGQNTQPSTEGASAAESETEAA